MKLATQISIGFLIVISIDLIDSYINYTLTNKVSTNTSFLTNSEAIIRNSSSLSKSIADIHNSFRGFLLTGDENFLAPYNSGVITIPALINQGHILTASPDQDGRLDSILIFNKLWINYANLLIKAKRKAIQDHLFLTEYQHLFEIQFKKQVAKSYADQIVNLLRAFDRSEYKIREGRRKALAASIKQTETFSIFFSALIILVGIVSAVFIVLKISKRIDSMVILAENISQGDFTKVNDDKKDELSSLSISLNSMSDKLSLNITELEKRNAELNQFAYVVSHDLKAPVRGIYNVIQWIEEDLDQEISPAMRKYLDIIPQRIERMEDLIDGLLDYARISREKPVKEETDVNVMVDELAEMIIPKEFEFSHEHLPELWTEKLLLQQVFSNLMSNAVKYTPSTNGRIEISCVEKENYYEFTVGDNGSGIDREYHEKIFVIFQTLREKHDKESTGIGLAIVKKIIEEKRCSINVDSSAGNGSKFIFTWPKY
jgi:signal transduction histidine kinase